MWEAITVFCPSRVHQDAKKGRGGQQMLPELEQSVFNQIHTILVENAIGSIMAPSVVDLGFSEGGFCYIIAWLKYMYRSYTHFQLNHAHFLNLFGETRCSTCLLICFWPRFLLRWATEAIFFVLQSWRRVPFSLSSVHLLLITRSSQRGGRGSMEP